MTCVSFLIFSLFLAMWFVCEFFHIVSNLQKFFQYTYWKKIYVEVDLPSSNLCGSRVNCISLSLCSCAKMSLGVDSLLLILLGVHRAFLGDILCVSSTSSIKFSDVPSSSIALSFCFFSPSGAWLDQVILFSMSPNLTPFPSSCLSVLQPL